MKKIFRYIIAVVLLLVAVSCEDVIPQDAIMEDGLSITIRTSDVQTRAEVSGDDALNENKINSIHYFVYAADPSHPDADPTASEPEYWGIVSDGLDKTGSHTIELNIPAAELNAKLFPIPYTTCDVYVIVNLPASITIGEDTDKTVEALRQIAVTANFETGKQANFVMEGLSKVRLINRDHTTAAEGEISVSRVAAKLSLDIDVAQSVTDSQSVTWYPDLSNMTVEFRNGIKKAVLSGEPVERIAENFFNKEFTYSASGRYVFYSYPTEWSIKDPEEAYIIITLPWSITEGDFTNAVENRYKLLISNTSFVSNTWYGYSVDINMLSNIYDPSPLPVEPDLTIADWSEGLNIGSELEGTRYLIVEQTEYNLYNENELIIPIMTSHPLGEIERQAVYTDFATNEVKTLSESAYSLIKTDDNKLILTHELNNNIYSNTINVSPITFTFTVHHQDDISTPINEYDNYKERIQIIQYPSIYITAENNRDYDDTDKIDDHKGYVWVNGYQGNDSGENTFLCNGGYAISSQSLNSHIMYIISISTLDGTEYILGDPRTKEPEVMETIEVNSNSEIERIEMNWAEATSLSPRKKTNTLEYYYPTNANFSDGRESITYNMIAPKLRVASSYGAIGDTHLRSNHDVIKARCASYQEDGRPAGRWRMPTKAELEFIFTLCNNNLITPIFHTSLYYWTAHGPYDARESHIAIPVKWITQSATSVRCVYDEWYWEQIDNKAEWSELFDDHNRLINPDQFIWGDMPRQDVKLRAVNAD